MTITPYGRTDAGAEVHRIALGGPMLRTSILTFGGVVERIDVPDRAGRPANVVLGLDSLDGYQHRSPHFGALPGRTRCMAARTASASGCGASRTAASAT